MVFKHLEDELDEENMLPYLEFHEELQDPTKTIVGYTLDIGSYLDSQGLSNRYTIFGGYGVLSNLMESFGESVAKTWRGSSDIDMAGDHDVLNSIRGGYDITNDRESPNIADKRTLKINMDGEEECKIDFYLGDPSEKYGLSSMNNHFGIPLRVLEPQYIIKGKLGTPKIESQHNGDILAMIAVLEREGKPIEEIMKILDHEQAEELQRRIISAENEFKNDRFGLFPGRNYLKDVKRELRRKRTIKS